MHIGKPSELVLTVQMLITASQFYIYYDPGLIIEYVMSGIIIVTIVLGLLNPI